LRQGNLLQPWPAAGPPSLRLPGARRGGAPDRGAGRVPWRRAVKDGRTLRRDGRGTNIRRARRPAEPPAAGPSPSPWRVGGRAWPPGRRRGRALRVVRA